MGVEDQLKGVLSHHLLTPPAPTTPTMTLAQAHHCMGVDDQFKGLLKDAGYGGQCYFACRPCGNECDAPGSGFQRQCTVTSKP
jgi:hypothetical protein